MTKTDEQLLKEANELDALYTSAYIHDLKNENVYLKRVLTELVCQINEDVSPDTVTQHFWDAVQTAEEALGYYEDPACE